MPYALFEDDDQLSRAFPTEKACWDHAEHAGLLDQESERLEDGLTIRPCPVDKLTDAKPDVDNWELPQLQVSDMSKKDLMRHADNADRQAAQTIDDAVKDNLKKAADDYRKEAEETR